MLLITYNFASLTTFVDMKTTGKPTNPLKTYYIIKGCLIAKSPYFRFQAAKPKQILISSRKKRHFKTWRESIIPKNSKIASNCVIKWRTNLGIDPIQSQQVFIIFLFICLLSKVTRLDSPSLPLVLVLCAIFGSLGLKSADVVFVVI